MKQFLKWGGIAILFAALVLFMGCPPGEDGGDDETAEVDWENYSGSDRAFGVRNNTNKELVAFRSSLSAANLIGGVKGNEIHYFKKSPVLTSGGTSDFPLILITKEDYVANKENLSLLNNNPFTRIYVFYNGQGDNNVVYEISGRLGGNKIIQVGNNSQTLNVEIRLGGIYGDTIGYAPAGQLITKLYVTEGDFDLFPVFKRYNNVRDIVETLYPKAASGNPWWMPLGFDDGVDTAYFSVSQAIDALADMTSGVAWLVINNQTGSGIHLVKGTQVVTSPTGVSYWNQGTKTFTIEMPYATAGTKENFAPSVLISSYTVGPNTQEKAIVDVENGSATLNLLADYMYTVNVTGNHNAGNLKAIVEMRITEDPETGEPYPGAPVKVTMSDWGL